MTDLLILIAVACACILIILVGTHDFAPPRRRVPQVSYLVIAGTYSQAVNGMQDAKPSDWRFVQDSTYLLGYRKYPDGPEIRLIGTWWESRAFNDPHTVPLLKALGVNVQQT